METEDDAYNQFRRGLDYRQYLKKAKRIGSDYREMLKLVPEVVEETEEQATTTKDGSNS